MSNLTDLLPAGGGGKNVDFVASGTLASGQTVALKTNGQVEAVSGVTQAVGSPVVFESASTPETGSAYDANAQKVVIAYRDSGNSDYGTAVVGTVSGTSISFGTPVVFETAVTRYSSVTYDANAQKIVIAYKDSGNSNYSTAIVGTVSGTSISFGTAVVIEAQNSDNFAITYDANAQKVVVAYQTTSNEYGGAIVGTVSGTSISFGSATTFENSVNTELAIAYDSSTQKVVVAYKDNGGSSHGTAIVGTVSGTSISFGSPVVFNAATTDQNSIAYDVNSQKIVIAYKDGGNSNYGTAIVGTVSGTSISFGSEVTFNAAATTHPEVVYDANAKKVVISYNDNNSLGEVIEGTVSGTSISFGSAVQFEPAAPQNITIVYDSTAQKVVTSYQDSGNSSYGTSFVFQAEATNNTDFIGISDAAISDTASGSVTIKGGIVSNSNLLPAVYTPSSGTPVVFEAGDIGNSNGLPSVAFDSNSNKIVIAYTDVANSNQGTVIVGTVSGTSISYGTAVVFETGITSFSSAVFDSNSNKIVIAYRDGGDSGYGKAIVGTVSGTSISFGTAVTFETANSDHISATFDSNSNKVVIAYRDDGNSAYGTAIVGTVSGTSISFGTAVVYASVNAQSKSMAFDSNLNKVIIAFRNFNNAGYSWAVVGTVSGTSISFGTTVVYSSTAMEHLSVIFDSSNNKAVLTARDSNNKGIAVVGTVSGTSISFGSAVIYSGSSTADWGFAVFDAAANKVVISYSDLSNSSRGTVIVGTVSGTSITFGTPVVFNNAGDTNYIGSGFDSNLNKVVTAYQDANNSNYGTSVVVTLTGASPALTIGTDYYVQNDGTLSTTTSTVLAGKALSSTSINLDYTT